MPVFISYRTLDKEKAQKIYNRLTAHHIKCWLDSVNAETNPATITQQILKGINDCTHLIAVVTPNTNSSWWVPYEVGVAEQGSRAITTFSEIMKPLLPEYLWHWPLISNDQQIDHFAAAYKKTGMILENVRGLQKNASAAFSSVAANIPGTAENFHKTLKVSLGQHL